MLEQDCSLGEFGDVRLDKGGGTVAWHALHAQCVLAPDGARGVVCADALLALCEQ